MKISVNDVEIKTLTQIELNVLASEIPLTILEEDLKRRLNWVVDHKYDQCFKRLKEQWEPKLTANGIESIPTDKDAFAQLVFSQPDYLDRAARDAAATQPSGE